jgi:hypothetical protein
MGIKFSYLVMKACLIQSTKNSANNTTRQSGASERKLSKNTKKYILRGLFKIMTIGGLPSFHPYSFMVCTTTIKSSANK